MRIQETTRNSRPHQINQGHVSRNRDVSATVPAPPSTSNVNDPPQSNSIQFSFTNHNIPLRKNPQKTAMSSKQVPLAYPTGGTFLDTLKKSFTDVPIDAEKDNAISTTPFLEAAESLTTLFDVLGSVAFTPVKNDMLGNVKKIRDRQLAAPAQGETLQELVVNELKTKKHIATEGLVWLVRYDPT